MNNRAAALETQYPYSPQAKAQVAALRAKAALYMQADSVSVDPTTGIQTKQLTGERLNAAAPNAHYVWNEQQGAYVDTTGVHPPVTPPSPRLTATPGGAILQSKPGGGATVVYQTPPGDMTTQEAAKTAGAAAGTTMGKLPGQLAELGRNAGQAIGNIDYGLSQVQKAKEGGIPTGYFAPWLGGVAAAAKSLGLSDPLQSLGINPTAVGNIQTAQKTLAVVSGAILSQILGPESQVTDAKIQHFIHAQPGIETDPDALGRVLNWARTQFVYEQEMAKQGMHDAKDTGTLPPGWQASYYDKHGFAPIYDPRSGEMQQPDGQAPGRTPALDVAPVNPSSRAVGKMYLDAQGADEVDRHRLASGAIAWPRYSPTPMCSAPQRSHSRKANYQTPMCSGRHPLTSSQRLGNGPAVNRRLCPCRDRSTAVVMSGRWRPMHGAKGRCRRTPLPKRRRPRSGAISPARCSKFPTGRSRLPTRCSAAARSLPVRRYHLSARS